MVYKKSTTPDLKAKFSLAADRHNINVLSFESDGKAILYSGKYKIGEDTIFENWMLASAFARAKGLKPIEDTEAGMFLSFPDRFDIFIKPSAIKTWKVASLRYCQHMKGDVRTFVCGSNIESVFRSTELPAILANKNITSINNKPVSYYADFEKNAYKRLIGMGLNRREAKQRSLILAYRRIAREELKVENAEAALNPATREDRMLDQRLAALFNTKATDKAYLNLNIEKQKARMAKAERREFIEYNKPYRLLLANHPTIRFQM